MDAVQERRRRLLVRSGKKLRVNASRLLKAASLFYLLFYLLFVWGVVRPAPFLVVRTSSSEGGAETAAATASAARRPLATRRPPAGTPGGGLRRTAEAPGGEGGGDAGRSDRSEQSKRSSVPTNPDGGAAFRAAAPPAPAEDEKEGAAVVAPPSPSPSAPPRTPPDNAAASAPGGFAACLLTKDDLHLLDEWLAYHSTMLPLAYLVAAIDPTSERSPLPLFEKWNGTQGMIIDAWTDVDFVRDTTKIRPHCGRRERERESILLNNHRYRQREFYRQCYLHMNERGMGWVTNVDSDEYLSLNPMHDDDPPFSWSEFSNKEEHPVLYRKYSKKKAAFEARRRLPASLSETTILDFVRREGNATPLDDACVVVPRLLFSAVDSTPEERGRIAGTHELGLNLTRTNTLRFFRHAKKGQVYPFNKRGKALVDVSKISGEELVSLKAGRGNPHRPFFSCPGPEAPYDSSLLRIHHYVGDLSSYNVRGDVRRNAEKYENKSKVNEGTTYDMMTWPSAFLKRVGAERGRELLGGAGEIRGDARDFCDGRNRARRRT